MVAHGNHSASGKPILTCDPHLGKTMNSFWYPTRIAWDAEDEQGPYRTFMAGGSLVGTPVFTLGRTPFAVFGGTALNPDSVDVFVELVKEEGGVQMHYDGVEEVYKEFEIVEETIKVRFWFDQTLQIKLSANGVMIPNDFLDDKA